MRFLLAVFVFVLAFSASVYGQSLSRQHNIEIEVECLETAREVVNSLNGYNLDAQASFDEWGAWATFTRRVDDWAFRHVQEVLRSLGEVHSEWERADELGAAILDLDTRFLVLSQEMERLSGMMAGSDSLEVLIAVNDRLAWVSRDRDGIIGRRNVLRSQVDSPVIVINLWQTPADAPPDELMGFGERVVGSFTNSVEGTLRFGGNMIVFFARYGLVLAIWMVLGGGFAYFIYKKFGKKTQEVVKNENAG